MILRIELVAYVINYDNHVYLVNTKWLIPGGGGLLPYLGYIGMCGAKGYGFQPFFLNDKVPILNILVLNRVWFVHPSLELGMFLRRIYFLIIRR